MTPVTFHGLSPYLYYADAGAALDWMSRVFGFQERVRYVDADGAVQEAEMAVGDASLHLTGLGPAYRDHVGSGPSGQLVIVYVDDVDAHHARVTAAGVAAPKPEDKPYGARNYTLTDPFGQTWTFWQDLGTGVQPTTGLREIRP